MKYEKFTVRIATDVKSSLASSSSHSISDICTLRVDFPWSSPFRVQGRPECASLAAEYYPRRDPYLYSRRELALAANNTTV